MNETAIKVEGLGKKYKIGRRKSGNLRESLAHFFSQANINKSTNQPASPAGRQFNTDFWALKDINFEVKQGEAIGIIGRNGAGKSTLLKILSRITKPTTGRFEINGRVSSLLEVGTGFHMELTGRENIFLNGTILGMKRREIKAKFDEILAFSGVEEFIDTPVKHYSSGMKVRLAFSVAAHLEPEILIIDEVLAVGDSVFQKKCLEKMDAIASGGKTILFVSHNLQAVKNLCTSGILLKSNSIAALGLVDQVIGTYMQSNTDAIENHVDLSQTERTQGKQGITFKSISITSAKILVGEGFEIKLKLEDDGKKYKDLLFGVNIFDGLGNCIIHISNIFLNKINLNHSKENDYRFIIKSLNIKPGRYTINLFLRANEDIQDWLNSVILFEVIDSNLYQFENSNMIQGLVQPEFEFEIK